MRIKKERNMKKNIGIYLAAISMSLASAAVADSEWGVFGSVWNAADGDTGVGGGVKIGIEMVERVQLDLRYSAVNNLIDSDVADLDVQPLEFGLLYAIPAGDTFEPYIGVGGGYYLMDGDVRGYDVDVDDEFGFYISTGLDIVLSRSKAQYGQTTTKLFVEAMYRIVDAGDMKVSGGNLDDADLSGLGAQAGLLIGW